MTPASVHREKRRREEAKHPLTVRKTEMQQDQIRAFGLFILVNTTPRIDLKF